MSILNVNGEDIAPVLTEAANAAGVPLRLALGCAIAESGLYPQAERWGQETNAARQAIANGDHGALAGIIQRTWPDISFGYGQQIVLYHYAGDQTATVANCLAVRDMVFSDPTTNLHDMCGRLASNLRRAAGGNLSPVGGDVQLGALVIYNAGSLKAPGDPWWQQWAGNVASYRRALVQADGMIANHGSEEPAEEPEATPSDDVAWMRTSLHHVSHDVADALESEAQRRAGPRKGRVMELATELRRYRP